MNRRTAVLGAGDHGLVVVSALQSMGVAPEILLDDDEAKWGGRVLGIPVSGPILRPFDAACEAVIAIGDNRVRRDLSGRLEVAWKTVVHPRAWVDDSARVAPGAMVMAGAVIQPRAIVGPHAIVNTGATVDHDCRVGAFAHLAPGVHLAGRVEVEEGALVGVGAALRPGVKIGSWATVGAGSAVVSDVLPGTVVKGVPAR